MTAKQIYVVQADILRKLPMRCTTYLPYTAGLLWAYAKTSPTVARAYTLREIIFLREPVEDAAARMEAPFLAAFSCYAWNTEYNKALARLVKQAHPGCVVLFGGHSVPPGGAMLGELPYVDYLIHGEGEIGFRALLEALLEDTPDVTAVPGLSYRTGHGTATNPEAALESVASLPSPYLEGIFDPIVAAHPEIQWSAILETNRGCPHHCVYCDWGKHSACLREFPMERILAEIDWMCANKTEYFYCADANFGSLPRDEAILDAVIAAKARTGYPDLFNCNTAKCIDERLFSITEKLNASGLDRMGPNFAVQSLSPEVLHNIGRTNLEDATIAGWLRRCRRAGYRTHTDLILGLPGETLQSFCAGIEKLFVLGQHDGIQYFPCYLLPNAAMAAPAYRERFRLRTARKIFKENKEDAPEKERVHEFIDTIIETSAMPHADWLTANYFILLAQGAHSFGLLRLAAMYLHTEGLVPYAEFYTRLLAFCRARPETLPGQAMARMERNFADSLHGEEPEPLRIPGFRHDRMAEDQYFFGRAVLEPERFYSDAAAFLRECGLGGHALEQLLRYQRESILLPGATPGAEKTLEFDYDFTAYFAAIYDGCPLALERRAVRLRFTCEYDLSSMEAYYHAIVQDGRYSSNAFYRTEYLPSPEGACA